MLDVNDAVQADILKAYRPSTPEDIARWAAIREAMKTSGVDHNSNTRGCCCSFSLGED